MKLSRIAPSLFAFAMVAALAACGGGGGGGSVNPPGGGGGPSSPPTQSPTNPPTNPPATNPPGGIGVSSQIINGYDGYVNGNDTWQTNGVTSSDTHDGDTSNGGNGSNSFNGVSCAVGSESAVTGSSYHVHAFVGLMVNGTEYAIPDAIGMKNPDSNEPVLSFGCAYNIHTHGASGIIHVEDPSIASGTAPPAKYNLQTLFDIWGQSISASGIAGFSGPVAIYTGTPSGKDSKGNDLVNSYTLSTASPSDILLKHHVAIWLVVGTPPSAGLPQVSIQLSN
jgi:hypothetical protein